jgi:hypothetical protein
MQYLIAFVVFCHGFIYVRIGAVLPGPIKGWQGHSWLLGDALTDHRLVALAIGLHVAAGLATVACAAAIGFAPLVPGLWRPLAVAGAAIGIAAFAVFWDGQIHLLFEEGVVGAVVSAVLLGAALTVPTAA